jgi:hypothetical protein
MANKLDQLISEIALSLNISEAAVISQFTQQELEEVLTQSNCVPDGKVPPLAEDVNVPCNDIGPVIEASSDSLGDAFDKVPDDKKKCIEATEEVSKILEIQLKEYNDVKQLLERLIEYRDNFNVITNYYSARSKECARILNLFEPLLKLRQNLESENTANNAKIFQLNQLRSQSTNPQTIDLYTSQISDLNKKISENTNQISLISTQLTQRTTQLPIFANPDITNRISGAQGDLGGAAVIALAVTDYLSSFDFNNIKNRISDYSECIKLNNLSVETYSTFVKSPVLEFKLDFINLEGIEIEEEKTNKETGESYKEKRTLLLKNNPLLKKYSFFNSVTGVKIKNNQVNQDYTPTGKIYTEYYNLFSDPINNFFSLDERGLTDSAALLDPVLRDSQSQTKIENGKEYYIRNQQTLQDFYKDFETRLEERKTQIRSQKIETNLNAISSTLEQLASMEIQLLLSLGKVNVQTTDQNSELKTIVSAVNDTNSSMMTKKLELDEEIERLRLRADEIKPEPAKVKKLLQQTNPECFGSPETADIEPLGCRDALKFAGTDPFFEKIGETSNVAYPNQGQLCYWLEFSKIATLMGLLPLPQTPASLRYWPVGLLIVTPATLIKVPLPIVWVPLFVLPTPMGQFVLFLTINGICITPMVLFNSSSGKKKFILSLKGASKEIGEQLDSEKTFSKLISLPLGAVAAAEKAKIIAKQAKDGKFYNLTEAEKQSLAFKKKIIENNLSEASQSGDEGRVLKLNKNLADIEAENLPKNPSVIAAELMDKPETAKDLLEKAKRNIFKNMNDLGNPAIPSLDSLKSELAKNKQSLSTQKYEALKNGNIEEYKKKSEELKNADVPYDKKIEAFTKDILNYVDRIKIPGVKYPSDISKIEPKLNPIISLKNQVEDLVANNSTGKLHVKQLSVKSKLSLHLIKAKEEILAVAPTQSFNIETQSQVFKDFLKVCVTKLIESASGIGGGLPSEDDVAEELALDDKLQSAQTDAEKKEIKNKLILKKKQNSRVQDKLKDGEEFSKGSGFISSLAASVISFNPFDVGAIPKTPGLDSIGIPPVLSVVQNTLFLAIDSLPTSELIKLTGGNSVISVNDAISTCFNLISTKLPNTNLPQIPLNIPAVTTALSAPLALTSEIKAPIPALAPFSVPAQIPVNLELLKEPIKEAIKIAISKIPADSESNPLKNIETINSNDLKAFLTSTIESVILKYEPTLAAITKPLEFAKSSNGVSLNVIEAAQFKVPPYGPIEEVAFNVKALAKAAIPKSMTIPTVDVDLLKEVVKRAKPVLEPLSTPPLSYLIAATAGLTETKDALRNLHPVLQNDDLPPWERLSSKNILFLLFLDDFIKTAADQTGFFRNFL